MDIDIVMGDFSSKVGSERTDNITEPFGIGKKNERENRLIEFCKEHNFTIMKFWFKNHPRRCYTLKIPVDRPQNQINFILFQERF